jgi:hypothetical protein
LEGLSLGLAGAGYDSGGVTALLSREIQHVLDGGVSQLLLLMAKPRSFSPPS